MPDDDFIEFGDTNLVPIENGWFLNKATKDKIDPIGRVYNESGELIFDPSEIEDIPDWNWKQEILDFEWIKDEDD